MEYLLKSLYEKGYCLILLNYTQEIKKNITKQKEQRVM